MKGFSFSFTLNEFFFTGKRPVVGIVLSKYGEKKSTKNFTSSGTNVEHRYFQINRKSLESKDTLKVLLKDVCQKKDNDFKRNM